MQFDYSKLKGRIIEKFGTYGEFAKALGKSKMIVSKKLNNKSKFSRDAIIEWSNLLEINVADYGIYFFTPKV